MSLRPRICDTSVGRDVDYNVNLIIRVRSEKKNSAHSRHEMSFQSQKVFNVNYFDVTVVSSPQHHMEHIRRKLILNQRRELIINCIHRVTQACSGFTNKLNKNHNDKLFVRTIYYPYNPRIDASSNCLVNVLKIY